jgi:hypothetical protein
MKDANAAGRNTDHRGLEGRTEYQVDMAMRLSKATAKLALSKLKAEFHHNINVSKVPVRNIEERGA